MKRWWAHLEVKFWGHWTIVFGIARLPQKQGDLVLS